MSKCFITIVQVLIWYELDDIHCSMTSTCLPISSASVGPLPPPNQPSAGGGLPKLQFLDFITLAPSAFGNNKTLAWSYFIQARSSPLFHAEHCLFIASASVGPQITDCWSPQSISKCWSPQTTDCWFYYIRTIPFWK